MDVEWAPRFLVLEGIVTVTELESMSLAEVHEWLDARSIRDALRRDYEKFIQRGERRERGGR